MSLIINSANSLIQVALNKSHFNAANKKIIKIPFIGQ